MDRLAGFSSKMTSSNQQPGDLERRARELMQRVRELEDGDLERKARELGERVRQVQSEAKIQDLEGEIAYYEQKVQIANADIRRANRQISFHVLGMAGKVAAGAVIIAGIGFGSYQAYKHIPKSLLPQIFNKSSYVEKYEKQDPLMLSRVFKGDSKVEYWDETYHLHKVGSVAYSPDKQKGAILYDRTFGNSVLIFNTVGSLMFRDITETLSSYDKVRPGEDSFSELYWEDSNTLTFKVNRNMLLFPKGNPKYMQINISRDNIGRNMRVYAPR